MLPDFIQQQSQTIAALCRNHHIKRMDLFGSATGERFEAQRSDLDFAVQFEALPPAAHAANFFALRSALRELFQRPVDLVEITAVRNPYILSRIQQQAVRLYGT